MTFLHKLARRLAGMKTALIMGAVATIACEIPLATGPSSTLAQLLLSPKISTLRTGQTTQFVVVGLTSTGDTAKFVVTWSTSGGSIVDTSTSGGKHYVHYKAPSQPGQYKITTQSTVAGLSAQSAAAGLSAQSTAAALSDSAVVNVSAVPVASVSLSPASANTIVGQTVQVTATPLDSTGAALTGRTVTWGSNNAAVATVSASGLVTGAAAGSATITATSEGKSGTVAVTVALAPVASVSVSPAAVSATIGQTAQLTAIPRDASGNALVGRVVTWGSSNTGVATVSGNGLVTSIAVGVAIMTATSEGKSGTASVTVTALPAAVASVSVSPASASVTAGQTVQLSATPRDASGNVLVGRVATWGSSNTGVATVNGSGLVTSVGAGSATITATSEGQSGSSAITVTAPVASVSVSPASTSVTAGQTVQLTATPRDASGNALTGRVVTWASSNTGQATVNGSGLVTGVSTGSATITATSEGKSGTAAVTVTPAPVASVSVSPSATSVTVGQAVQLTATPRDANGTALTGRVITWGSSNTAVATLSGSGLVSGVAVGSATITATSEGQSGTAAVTVTAAPPPGTTWPNEPAGFTVIADYGFDDVLPVGQSVPVGSSGWSINNGSATRVSDASAPVSPMNVGQWKYPAGMVEGGAPATMYYETGAGREMYVGLWWKASNPFNASPSGVNKIAFTWSQSNLLSYINMEGQGVPYHITIHDAPLGNGQTLSPNITASPVALGVWHRIELYQKYSTTATSGDGIVRWWVDGVLNGDYTNLNFAQDAGFGEFQLSPTYGGNTGATKTEDDYYWYDHVHISRR
jgi:uncharacterized protein YjdB